jgi:hypothetical protein
MGSSRDRIPGCVPGPGPWVLATRAATKTYRLDGRRESVRNLPSRCLGAVLPVGSGMKVEPPRPTDETSRSA